MTYDFHGPWGGPPDVVTNFNSPLHVASDDPLDEPYHSQFNLAAAVQNYLDRGVPLEKLHPGLAFYGRGYRDVNDFNNGLFADYSGASSQGTWEAGMFDFWDIDQNYVDTNGYTAHWHAEAKVPWVYSPSAQVMISYDDAASIHEKGNFIVERDLGGAMFWEFSADRDGALLDAVYDALQDSGATGLDEEASTLAHEEVVLHCVPNPFVSWTMISFRLPVPAFVSLRIYDAAGRRVRTLMECWANSGIHGQEWDCTDNLGRTVQNGLYFLRLVTGKESLVCHLVRIE
jgi:hypothetical protein